MDLNEMFTRIAKNIDKQITTIPKVDKCPACNGDIMHLQAYSKYDTFLCKKCDAEYKVMIKK